MLYQRFLSDLKEFSDEKYKDFHAKLLNNPKIKLIGVRVPYLRKLAKKYERYFFEVFNFSNEYYETVFIKLTIISSLQFNEFIDYVDKAVSFIDNWATCDCFKPKCIKRNKDEFLPFIYKYLQSDNEFTVRFAITSLLNFYVDEKYLHLIFCALKTFDKSKYYVHMACAWLVAEILVKYYSEGVAFLQEGVLDKKTHNKSIQKAVESLRLSVEKKII